MRIERIVKWIVLLKSLKMRLNWDRTNLIAGEVASWMWELESSSMGFKMGEEERPCNFQIYPWLQCLNPSWPCLICSCAHVLCVTKGLCRWYVDACCAWWALTWPKYINKFGIVCVIISGLVLDIMDVSLIKLKVIWKQKCYIYVKKKVTCVELYDMYMWFNMCQLMI